MHTFKPNQLLNYPTQKTAGHEDYIKFTNTTKKDGSVKFIRYSVEGDCIVLAGNQYWTFSPSDLTPKSEVFKVRVVNVSSPDVWYTYLVGATEIFTVKEKDEFNYKIIGGGRHGLLLLKSDCIVVTDQKFKVGDRVKHNFSYVRLKGVIDKVETGKTDYPYKVNWDNGKSDWYSEDSLELDDQQSSVHPFTEELFNQGNYEVYKKYGNQEKLKRFSKVEGIWVGYIDGDGCWYQYATGDLLLKEKEVVVYHVATLPGKYLDLKSAISDAVDIGGIVTSWNETTRTVEKVWDFLTDKK